MPFRSEVEFLVPFLNSATALKKIHSTVLKMLKESVFPFGPFMLDFILDLKEELYLIDSAPRFSATVAQFLEPCYGDTSYIKRSISALLNKKINIQQRAKPLVYVYSKKLPLPKGELISFSKKEAFSEHVIDWKFNLNPGETIFQERNDALSARKGHITVTGKDIESAKKRWSQEYKKLDFLIKKV